MTLTVADYLERFRRLHPTEIDLSLNRIKRLLADLGDPQARIPPIIHIAGTNGKGSVLAYLEAMLHAGGKRVHVFSSPFIQRYNEYVRLAAGTRSPPITDAYLLDLFARVEAANAGRAITFFEAATAVAFLAFAETPADIVLLEVGLGGRFDSTNVIDHPLLTVITPIGIDHVEFLGSDIKGIAYDKAGVMKKGVPCLLAQQERQVEAVLEDAAREVGAILVKQGRDWSVSADQAHLHFHRGGQDAGEDMTLPLPRLIGRHQVSNAGMAIAAITALPQLRIGPKHIAQGLTQVYWPARLQLLRPGPLGDLAGPDRDIWLDGAHNAAAAEVIAAAMRELEEQDGKPLVLITGMMARKDALAFFRPFVPVAREVIAVNIPDTPNTYAAEELAEKARQAGLPARALDSPAEALADLKTRLEGPARILICGSFVLAGQVLTANGEKLWED